jgi:parallel beta-helix repeat protein
MEVKTMKKLLVLLSIFLFCAVLGLNGALAAPQGGGRKAADVDCEDPCIDTNEIEDGEVNSADIADGAVTDAKITGPVSASKIGQGSGSGLDADFLDGMDSSDIPQKPANVVVVAQSGGDYASIQAAVDSILPSAENPYVIEVMPGTYVENITMKSYVHLRGSGREVTTIESPSTSPVIDLLSLTDVAISGLTIKGGNWGILNNSSSPTITANTITGNGVGIFNTYSSSPVVTGNTITDNSFTGIGIGNDHSSSPTITGNTITGYFNGIVNFNSSSPVVTGNNITGNIWGIVNDSSSPAITANTIIITGDGIGILNFNSSSPNIIGNTIAGDGHGITNESSSPNIEGNTIIRKTDGYGIFINDSSSPMIIHNRITLPPLVPFPTGEFVDISVSGDSYPNISFNVYDTISGTTGEGQYNVKSDGSPAVAP